MNTPTKAKETINEEISERLREVDWTKDFRPKLSDLARELNDKIKDLAVEFNTSKIDIDSSHYERVITEYAIKRRLKRLVDIL